MPESIDVPLLLSVLEQVMPALELDANPRRAKQLAKQLALQIESIREFGLAGLAGEIDEQSPETIHRFVSAAQAALNETQMYQQKVAANADSSASALRHAVLEQITELDSRKNNGDFIWFLEIQWQAGLSQRQTRAALMDLRRMGVIEVDEPAAISYDTFAASRLKLKKSDRRLAQRASDELNR